MTILRNPLILFLMITACLSCSQNTSTPIRSETITLNLSKSDLPEPSMFSEHLKSIRVIPLESNPEAYINRISQINVVDDKIFILDSDRTRGIFVFNMEGKFLYKFGSKGKGPGEFIIVNAFSFSPNKSKIYIADYEQKKIIEYSLNGNFLQEIFIDNWFNGFQFLSDSVLILSNSLGPAFSEFNINTKKLKIHPLILGGARRYGAQVLFRTSNNEFLYPKPRLDSIYAINRDTIYPKYIFNFGSNKCTNEEFRRYRRAGGKMNPPNKIFMQDPILETSVFFFFGLELEGDNINGKRSYRRKYFARNRKTAEIFNITDDNILFCGSYAAKGIGADDEFISCIGATRIYDVKEKIMVNMDFNYPKNMKNIIQNVKEDDNPVLVLYKLK